MFHCDLPTFISQTEKVEFAVYESMAMSCCGWAFQWNKFNSDCDMNKIVLSSGQCSSDNWNGLKEENNQLDKVHNIIEQIINCANVL